jgi:hypothetical protein
VKRAPIRVASQVFVGDLVDDATDGKDLFVMSE